MTNSIINLEILINLLKEA